MPELPEVETCRAGIAPHIERKTFKEIIVRQSRLRWPIPASLPMILPGTTLDHIVRRGKYLLFACSTGHLILHLGMSGNLRITTFDQPPGKHDHIDFIFEDGTVLRFNDQRRFGTVLWTTETAEQHPLLSELGPEPLSAAFDGAYLLRCATNRNLAVKSLLMDSRIVVGVGNIYANESLFMSALHPALVAGKIDLPAYERLAASIKTVLQSAIAKGGTTLRDFTDAAGKPGYFRQSLMVYGRAGQPCLHCGESIQVMKIAQRSSYFCRTCQQL